MSSKLGVHEREVRWQTRIRRAQELRDRRPEIAAMLGFYEAVLGFQAEVARGSNCEFHLATPLREQIDIDLAVGSMASLLSLAIELGPEKLSRKAGRLEQQRESDWRKIVDSVLDAGAQEQAEIDNFFGRACLQPMAENLQSQLPEDASHNQSVCPACGGLPQLSVLRPEGEGASRWLLCSFCLREWLYRRIVCPWCGEENKEKLPRYSAEECAHVHIQACDTCRRYLKAVDMTVDGHAVPLIDEAAVPVLDIWATTHEYTKIIPNLLGF